LSATIAIMIGFTINYALNIKWVFSYRKYLERPLYEYILMAAISLFVSGLNIIGIWFLSEFVKVYYITSKIIISIFTFLIKFIVRKKILFQARN